MSYHTAPHSRIAIKTITVIETPKNTNIPPYFLCIIFSLPEMPFPFVSLPKSFLFFKNDFLEQTFKKHYRLCKETVICAVTYCLSALELAEDAIVRRLVDFLLPRTWDKAHSIAGLQCALMNIHTHMS